jgi:anthranilate synthase/aminodeoxychorismate synthase-like glutamine amidotransferase
MRVLIVDNIDSFVYNLFQYVGLLGGEPVVLENTAGEDAVDRVMREGIDRIIISPGPKRPEDAGVSNHVIREYGRSIPLLGVCLGHQCIGSVYGADIVHAKTQMHGKLSPVEHDGIGIFRGLASPFNAVRYHSLAVDESSLPDELVISARAVDGEIMGLRHKRYPVFGVQFHPESILTEGGLGIIKNFLGVSDD